MKYVSLFAGIGGFDLALNRLGHECVYANEWDKYAAEIYRKNFGTNIYKGDREGSEGKGTPSTLEQSIQYRTQSLGSGGSSTNASSTIRGENKGFNIDTRDIRTVPTSEIPDHDLLVGGFPCQAFSIAGKRMGFNETRGTLFFEIARILKDKNTPYFILENVKGLLSHDNGRTFKVIISTLTELGYDLEWQVLNSKNFGVPQNRERVFIVGHLRGQPRPQVFPIGADDELPYGEDEAEQRRSQAEISHTLKGSNMKADNAFIVHNVYGGFGEDTNREFHDIAPTVRTPQGGGHIPDVVQGTRIRRLTPVECERLQGFPDGWTEGVSDTQRYKCLGNAVTVNVVYEIAKRLEKR